MTTVTPEARPAPALPPEGEERELCPNCLTGNVPGTNFCSECGGPLSAYAAIGPFERLFAEGHIYRKATQQPHRLIVVLGIWLIFGPMALIGMSIPFMEGYENIEFEPGDVLGLVAMLVLVTISVALILKTTRNYITRSRTDGDSTA